MKLGRKASLKSLHAMTSFPTMKLLLAALVTMNFACSAVDTKFGKGKKSENGLLIESSDLDITSADVDDGPKDSQKAFAETAYLFLKGETDDGATCGVCHASTTTPFFSSEDPEKAWKEVVDNKKVNFIKLEKSRLVERLSKDSHNCWSGDCQADAEAMTNALQAWKDAITDGSLDNLVSEAQKNTTEALLVSAGVETQFQPVPGTTIQQAESATLDVASPLFVDNVYEEASGSYLTTANNGVTLNADQSIGVTYTFTVTEAGTYYVFARMSAPDAGSDSIFIKVNDGPFENSRAVRTEVGEFQWRQSNQNNNLDLSYELEAGTHTVEVRQREDGVSLDLIALTNDPEFTGGAVTPEDLKELVFDISSLAGEGAKFSVQVSKFDEFSFLFTSPKIIAGSKDVKVKGVKILINGIFDANNSGFLYIDDTIAAGETKILAQNAMIASWENGYDKDEISIQFETIE